MLLKNCCDGIYNSLDVHFTSACDNKCAHCIDLKYDGLGVNKPDVESIINTITNNSDGIDDVLFLGGEPCLYLPELIHCIKEIKRMTSLKIYVTTSVPKTCYDNQELFCELISLLDGINLSVQHHVEDIADQIRNTESKYDRQAFYKNLPMKEKIRINLNIVKPYLYSYIGISHCLMHYDAMGFNSIKLSEIQHGKDCFVSFEDVFGIKLKPAYTYGCQTYLKMGEILPGFKTPILLKRSCFMCEETLEASLIDGAKALYKLVIKPKNNYGVVYGDGSLTKGWI